AGAVREPPLHKPFIIVTGCYAKISPDELSRIDGIDLIEHNPKKIARDFLKVPLLSGIKRFSGRDKAFVKVQEGCDQFCSYCIVPYARGKPRERPLKEILQEVRDLAQNGYQELILTGTNLGKYENLLNVIQSIEKIPDVRRLGLGSIEPVGISDELLEFIGNSKKCSKYFHIPLQSGDNKILKSMRRWYTREEYEALLHRIKEKVPDSAIGADVIVGFPGEGKTEFSNTYNLIANSPISRLHIFRYSRRPMTQALNLENEPQDIIKKERSRTLIELGEKKWMEFRTQFIGKTLEAHIESSTQNGWIVGVSSNYIKVLLQKQNICAKCNNMDSGFVNLRIKKIDGVRTYGEIVK
ncbi:MiaB/RimO family radical SAM methylthiotransferase, partial [candidate division WOR-3 bacterium]|nr:MiaB/RimO family radical SAM methylthiotransferase [candidate division WOR-3 bacterium]